MKNLVLFLSAIASLLLVSSCEKEPNFNQNLNDLEKICRKYEVNCFDLIYVNSTYDSTTKDWFVVSTLFQGSPKYRPSDTLCIYSDSASIWELPHPMRGQYMNNLVKIEWSFAGIEEISEMVKHHDPECAVDWISVFLRKENRTETFVRYFPESVIPDSVPANLDLKDQICEWQVYDKSGGMPVLIQPTGEHKEALNQVDELAQIMWVYHFQGIDWR